MAAADPAGPAPITNESTWMSWVAIEGARARISQSDNWSQIHKVHSLLANLEYAFLRAGGELQPAARRYLRPAGTAHDQQLGPVHESEERFGQPRNRGVVALLTSVLGDIERLPPDCKMPGAGLVLGVGCHGIGHRAISGSSLPRRNRQPIRVARTRRPRARRLRRHCDV